MDWRQPAGSCEDASISSRIIILTTFERDDYVFEALRAGASGFLLKNCPPEDLVHAVRVVATGDALLAPSVTRTVIEAFAQRRPGAQTKPNLGASLSEKQRSSDSSQPGRATPSWQPICSLGREPSRPTFRACSPSWVSATECKRSSSPTKAALSNLDNCESRAGRPGCYRSVFRHPGQSAERVGRMP